ncbi:unnamed protein product [Paramecium sonneborni]|uniref:Protein YIPF n=1 Tax=Paramecium sonneborni TaxID=65129 RepID=A0A8S1QUM2_9CILI|nr:unnamed protein product [Paramecium sonneborni]
MDYTNQRPPQNYSQMDDQKTQDLEESVSETIMRDLKMIAYKLKYVLIPKEQEDNGKELRNWDLWGPLIFCLVLAMTLSFKAESTTTSTKSDVFAIIFVLIWVGAFIVTLNAQLLGGKVSFFQSVCLLGYCVFPINIEAIIIAFFGSYLPFLVKLIPVFLCFAWSAYSSVGFMASLVPPHKKKLAVYPVFLFYLFLSWFSLIV